jgi:hypothetical protein
MKLSLVSHVSVGGGYYYCSDGSYGYAITPTGHFTTTVFIRFAKGTGGHAPALEVAEQAARHGVRRLVFAHVGRPAIAALDAGHVPPFGEIGTEGGVYTAG